MAHQGIEASLDVSHLRQVLQETNSANVKWYDIGIQIGLESFVLDGIRVQWQAVPADCFREMIKEWLNGVEANWQRLQHALRSSTVREHMLATQIQTKYLPQTHKGTDSTRETIIPKSTRGNAAGTGSDNGQCLDHVCEIVPYGCGCGNCTFPVFLDKGCSKPKGSTSHFPFLDTKELSEIERQVLEGRLYDEFQLISRKFSHLTSTLCNSLIDRNVSVKQLVRTLRDLKAFQPIKSDTPLLQDRYEKIKQAEDIDDIFEVVSEYVSFFSFHIIEHIINELGNKTDDDNLEKYKGYLMEYCSRNIFECPSYSTLKKGQACLVLKVEEAVEAYNMKLLNQLTVQIIKILSLSKYTLLLCSVERGCIQLMYQLPSFVPETIFPLSAKQEDEFAEAGFTKMVCSEWTYSFCFKTKHNQVSTNKPQVCDMPPLPPPRRAAASLSEKVVTDSVEVLDHYKWYHGDISRQVAENLLRKTQSDSFLVRRKDEYGQYALSEVFANQMKHYIVKKTNGVYELEDNAFQTIKNMVDYLMQKYDFQPCQRSGRIHNTIELKSPLGGDWIDPGSDFTGDSDWTGTGEEWTGTGDSGFQTKLPLIPKLSPCLTSPSTSPERTSLVTQTLTCHGHDDYASLLKEKMDPPPTYARLQKPKSIPSSSRSDIDDYKDIEQIYERIIDPRPS